jgi:hypothetical protein
MVQDTLGPYRNEMEELQTTNAKLLNSVMLAMIDVKRQRVGEIEGRIAEVNIAALEAEKQNAANALAGARAGVQQITVEIDEAGKRLMELRQVYEREMAAITAAKNKVAVAKSVKACDVICQPQCPFPQNVESTKKERKKYK